MPSSRVKGKGLKPAPSTPLIMHSSIPESTASRLNFLTGLFFFFIKVNLFNFVSMKGREKGVGTLLPPTG